jgi:ATP-dependent Clp protease ATP-binding subunit ClpA
MDDIFQPNGRLRPEVLGELVAAALEQAVRLARETHWERVRSPHLFMGLLAVPDAGVLDWGERLKADLPGLLRQFEELFFQENGEIDPFLLLHREFLSDNAILRLREAHGRALDHGRSRITHLDLLISLLTGSRSIVAETFEQIGVTAAKLTELAVLAEHAGRDNEREERSKT